MIHYSVSMEKTSDKRKILTLLMMIDIYNTEYTITLSCDEATQKYVQSFPYRFSGSLDFVCDMPETENFVEMIRRKLSLIRHCITKLGSTLHMSVDLISVRKFSLPSDIGDIAFVKKHCLPAPDHDEQQYNLDLLYVSSTQYVDFIEKLIEEGVSEVESDNYNQESEDTDVDSQQAEASLKKRMIEKCQNIWSLLALKLVDHFSVDKFLDFNSCIGSEDFFAYDNILKIENIDKNFSCVFYEDQNKDGEKDTEGSKETSDPAIISEHPIYFVNVRLDQMAPPVQLLNKQLFSKLVNYNIRYMAIINLRFNAKNLEFTVPKRDGIVIWDRSQDSPGMYELIDLMVDEYSDFLTKTEVDIEYFSFNNFLLFDKNDKVWLTNNVKKYTEFFICNYDSELPKVADTLPIPNKFLCYYSDEPRKLENNRNIYISRKKAYDVVSIRANTIKTFKYLSRSDTLREKDTIDTTDMTWERIYGIISKSKFVMIDTIDVNLIANCLAMQVVIISNKDITLLDIEKNKHYIHYDEIKDRFGMYKELANECNKYYIDNISPKGVALKILNHVFVRSV